MRFSVRGTNSSPLETLGLSALPGNSLQAADAYIVIDYITSQQVIIDITRQLEMDIKSFFSKDDIDFIYRVDQNIPIEKFIDYWRWMTDASFNSTTGITTFRVNAFTGEDAGAISKAVLKVASKLVNDLSTEARVKLIQNAQTEVERTEKRLIKARAAKAAFRDKEQSVNPTLEAQSDQALIQGLQKELINLRARKRALLGSVDINSPSVRVLDRQIDAIVSALAAQRQEIGSGTENEVDTERNLSAVFSEYSRLELEQQFAETAYTSALSSLETSQAEARKQERYFAIVLEPTIPTVALYPLRFINTLIAFGTFLVIWLLSYLIIQAIKEHTI